MTAITPIHGSTHVKHDGAILPVIGDLVYSNRAIFAAAVDVALGAGVSEITVDLTQCPKIDSSGMGALVSAAKKGREHACRIQLVGLPQDLRDVFTSTGLESLFDWPESSGESPDPEVAHD